MSVSYELADATLVAPMARQDDSDSASSFDECQAQHVISIYAFIFTLRWRGFTAQILVWRFASPRRYMPSAFAICQCLAVSRSFYTLGMRRYVVAFARLLVTTRRLQVSTRAPTRWLRGRYAEHNVERAGFDADLRLFCQVSRPRAAAGQAFDTTPPAAWSPPRI